MEQNPRQSTKDIAGRLNTSQSTVCRHLEKLGKVNRMSIATSLLSRVKIEPFLDRIITGDKKWVIYDNMSVKDNIIYHEFLKSNLMITADTYVQQLQRVKEKLYEKHPALVNRKNIILLHDKVTTYTSNSCNSVKKVVAKFKKNHFVNKML
ncbi:hypothetical protein ACFW04_014656 [Cataglyphis niger]